MKKTKQLLLSRFGVQWLPRITIISRILVISVALNTLNPFVFGAKAGIANDDPQQQITITGRVTDVAGDPLPGVSVIIKGSTSGILTDVNGNYTLPNVPTNATLQFSFVGMKVQEVVVGSRTVINVTLEV